MGSSRSRSASGDPGGPVAFGRPAGWLLVAVIGLGSALLFAVVATNHVLAVQVVAAAVGAVMATGGAALAVASWPRRRASDLHNLLAAIGVFAACAGAVALLAGVGIYH